MARYDVYRAPDGSPALYLLDLQSDLLDITTTRVVAPVFGRNDYLKPAAVLHPDLRIEDQPCVLLTHLLATVDRSELGYPVANLAADHFSIVAALDKLFSGI